MRHEPGHAGRGAGQSKLVGSRNPRGLPDERKAWVSGSCGRARPFDWPDRPSAPRGWVVVIGCSPRRGRLELRALVASDLAVGLELTIFDPDLDPMVALRMSWPRRSPQASPEPPGQRPDRSGRWACLCPKPFGGVPRREQLSRPVD